MIQESQAVIVFLDIYQAFVTAEHPFLYKVLKVFWFGGKFTVISVGKMLYTDISSILMIYPSTSNRLPVNRSAVHLFLIVVELIELNFLKLQYKRFVCLSEIRITQLADDTV